MGLSYGEVLTEYRQYDMLVGTTVRVHHQTREIQDERDYNALVLGFTDVGFLKVRNESTGKTVSLSAEEISISPSGHTR